MIDEICRHRHRRKSRHRTSHGPSACADFSVIVLVARNKDNLERTAAEVRALGTEAMVFALDLRQPQSAKTIIEETLERFGRIDALLNIAGAVPQIDLFQMTDAQWDDGMALKLNGARRLTVEAWTL